MEPLGARPAVACAAPGGIWAAARFWTSGELAALLEEAGLGPAGAAGAVFYPQNATLARLVRPLDRWLGWRIGFGAAFLAVAGCREAGPS